MEDEERKKPYKGPRPPIVFPPEPRRPRPDSYPPQSDPEPGPTPTPEEKPTPEQEPA